MKKSILCILIIVILLFITKPIFGRSGGFIPIGIGLDFSKDGANINYDVCIGRLETSSYEIGIGIGWEILKYNKIKNEHYFSIINPIIYWNIFEPLSFFGNYHELSIVQNSMFGPFLHVNYAPNRNFQNYILFTGLRFTYTSFMDATDCFLFHIEAGYRYIKDRNINNLYINVKIDIMYPVLFGSLYLIHKIKKNE
ncbi:MAG: hypothetical protein LBU88_07155 [Treponema sp.]|jgi:hypothetical protein|nr:hypothetical protein [Treponema sp.]